MVCVNVSTPLLISGFKVKVICSLFSLQDSSKLLYKAVLFISHVLFVRNSISNIRLCLDKRSIK